MILGKHQNYANGWGNHLYAGRWYLSIWNDYVSNTRTLDIALPGDDLNFVVETINLEENPELLDIYDEFNQCWNELELPCFLNGLQIWLA